MKSRCFKAVTLAFGLSLAPLAAAQADVLTRSGVQVPGEPSGTLLDRLCQLTFDINGTALLRTSLSGAPVTSADDEAAQLEGNQRALLAREGSAAPGTLHLFDYVKPASINAGGEVLLSASLSGTGVTSANDAGLWIVRPGTTDLVVRKGDQAAGLVAGNLYGDFSDAALNDGGALAFLAGISPGGAGIWTGQPGSLSPFAITGDAAPGTTATLSALSNLRFNGANAVAFWASIAGSGVTGSNDTGLWSGTAGALGLVAREGGAAPGLAPLTYGEFDAHAIALNESGDLSFTSRLAGSGVNSSNDRALWLSNSGGTSLVARTGNTAPGTSAAFGAFQESALSDSGALAFLAFLTGTAGDRGIWTGDASSQTLAARFGLQAPGAAAGETFVNFFDLNLNASDELAFGGVLNGTGVTPSNDRGIWGGVTGDLRLIAREGDSLSVAPGTDLTIQSFPPKVTLNDAGQLSIPVRFTDGSYALLLIDLRAKDEVVADFGAALGLWTRQGNGTWRRLHGLSPGRMAAGHLDGDPREELVGDFGAGLGLWTYRNNTAWEKLHGANAENMLTAQLDRGPDADTVVDFGSTLGLWARFNDGTWTKLHGSSPEAMTAADMDGDGQQDLVAVFTGLGIWVWTNNTSWQRLSTADAQALAAGDLDADGRDDVVVDFGVQGMGGLWIRFNNSTWTRIHSSSPAAMTTANMDGGAFDFLVAAFGAPNNGLWTWRDGTWRRLHQSLPQDLATADLDRNGAEDVVVDFGLPLGLWARVNDSLWQKLHGGSPEDITDANLDNR